MIKAAFHRSIAACLLFAMVMGVLVLAPAETAYGGVALPPDDYTSFTVYFPLYTKLGSFAYPVRYLVPKTSAPARAAMEALIAGLPNGSGAFIRLPDHTMVLGVSIVEGVFTVDFSGEIRNLNVGSGGEAAIIYSIVATADQFPNIDWVEILVDGEPLDTLAGHVDISGPLPVDGSGWLHIFDDAFQHWSGGAVGALIVQDVIDGYPDGTYKPDDKVTRAEFIKMLVEGLKLPAADGIETPFADVVGQWHEDYILRALGSGLIGADTYGNNLKPDEVMPRDEMAYLLVVASQFYSQEHPEIEYTEVSPVPAFSDINDAQDRYRAAIIECARLDLLRGFPGNLFKPKEGLTRGEAATVISRVLGMTSSDDIVRSAPLTGADYDGGDLVVLGAARAFEANVNWRIENDNGDILSSYVTTSEGMGWGVFGLHVDADLFAEESPTAFELFLVSAMDGSEYSSVNLPLVESVED